MKGVLSLCEHSEDPEWWSLLQDFLLSSLPLSAFACWESTANVPIMKIASTSNCVDEIDRIVFITLLFICQPHSN